MKRKRHNPEQVVAKLREADAIDGLAEAMAEARLISSVGPLVAGR